MNTIQHLKQELDKRTIWNLSYMVITTGLFLFLLSISEFYNVAIDGSGSQYPWGAINENPWYYRTPALYAAYQFICSLVFLTASIVTLLGTIRKSQPVAIKGMLTIGLFFLANLVSAHIQ